MRTQELASFLAGAVRAVKAIVDDNGFTAPVFMGRDCHALWVLYPGPAGYFNWSRVIEDPWHASDLWKKEFPQGCLIVDSGFKGSIPDKIRMFDNTAGAFLLSREGRYGGGRTIAGDVDSDRSYVMRLEDEPKAHGRVTGFEQCGCAVCGQCSEDSGTVVGFEEAIEREHRLLRKTGLPYSEERMRDFGLKCPQHGGLRSLGVGGPEYAVRRMKRALKSATNDLLGARTAVIPNHKLIDELVEKVNRRQERLNELLQGLAEKSPKFSPDFFPPV